MFKSLLTLWLIVNFILVHCADMSQNVSSENIDSQNNVKLFRQRRQTRNCEGRSTCCRCLQWLRNENGAPKPQDGVRKLEGGVMVECDMTGGGWTVIQKRELCGPVSTFTSFNRNWAEYKNGFGSPDWSHWLGLEKIKRIVEAEPQIIKFDMESFDPTKGKAFAIYNHFSLSGDNYKLDIGEYDISSTAGDSILNPAYSQWNVNGMNFSANDLDNDGTSWIKCAQDYQGGWWFKDCVDGYPNGLHHESRIYDYNAVTWPSFDSYYSLKYMKISLRHKDGSRCG